MPGEILGQQHGFARRCALEDADMDETFTLGERTISVDLIREVIDGSTGL